MSNKPLENLFAELEELNRKIIELCCNHRRYADKIPDALNDYMAAAAYTEYVQQHELHVKKLTAAAETELYNIQAIADISTPVKRRRWFWPWSVKRNYAAQCIDAKLSEYAKDLIDQILAQTTDMKDEFCRSWAKLLQAFAPGKAEEQAAAEDAAPATAELPAQEQATGDDAAPPDTDGATPPDTDGAAAPDTPAPQEPAPAETWEEENEVIPEETFADPS